MTDCRGKRSDSMALQYMGLNDLSGSLVIIEGMKDIAYDEIVEITVDDGEKRIGRVVELTEEFAVIQVCLLYTSRCV